MTYRFGKLAVGGVLMFALGWAALPAMAQPGTKDGQWTYYGGDAQSTRYAPLDQINKDNFSQLKVVWTADSPDGYLSKTEAGGEWRADYRVISDALAKETPRLYSPPPRNGSFKGTPLMAEGMIFVSTPLYQAAAYDARTGKTIWIYDPKSYNSGTPPSLTWNSRGCAYWSDGTESRVIWGTGDGYVIAVDAKTGRPCADFGDKGRVDMTIGIPRAERGKRDEDNHLLLCMKPPPLIMADTVICGSATMDTRNQKETPAGWVQAFDVHTGKKKWDFHTIPLPGEYGSETWENGANAYTGSANAWSMLSGDPELGYVYLPLTTPSNDYYGGHRPGDGLFAESLVCVNVKDGKRIWHFQAVHHGMWDYDFPSAPMLFDTTVDGKPRKLVAQLSKQGFCYVFDRVSGEPIWPIIEKPVPTSPTVPGEKPSPTQPHPTKPLPLAGQGTTEDQVNDLTPEIHKAAMEILSHYQTGPLFQPQTVATTEGTWGTIARPSLGGATTWPGGCVDPELGYLFVPSRNTTSITYFYQPNGQRGATVDWTKGGRPPNGVSPLRGPLGLPANFLWKPPYSTMRAIDMHTGDSAWVKASGNGSAAVRNNPVFAGVNLPPLGGEGRGGPIVTKTLMISSKGGAGGDYGGVSDAVDSAGPGLLAYDKNTGEEIGFAPLPSSPIGVPMTYMLEGRQYIAISCQGTTPRVVCLALPSAEDEAGQRGGGGRGGRGGPPGGFGGRGGGFGGGRGGGRGPGGPPEGARGAEPPAGGRGNN